MTTGLRYQFQYHRTTAPKRLSWSPDLAPSISDGAKSPIIHPERHHQGVSQTNFVLGNVVENWVNINFVLGNVVENWVHISFALGNVAENWVHISFVLGNVAENWVHISFALGNVAENWVHISFVLSNVAENWVHTSFALGNVVETDIALMMSRGIVSSLPASAVCAFIFFFFCLFNNF